MRKRAIQLSVNFLVMFVLGIIMFGLAMSFLYLIFGQAQDLNQMTRDDIENRVTELQCQARDVVCISGNREEYNAGETAFVGVFIYNIYDEEQKYSLEITKGAAVDRQKEPITDEETKAIISAKNITIQSNQQDKVGVAIELPTDTPQGTYSYSLHVHAGSKSTEKKKIYLTVK